MKEKNTKCIKLDKSMNIIGSRNMRFFLLRMKEKGIKSIDKEIQLDFYKSTVSKHFHASNSHVKAIYGPNGAGKTAIVDAVAIYKNLVIDFDYLAMSNTTGALDNLINQKSRKLEVEMYFAVLQTENRLEAVYSHKLVLEKINERYVITEESLRKLVGNQLNKEDAYKIIFEIKHGEMVQLSDSPLEKFQSFTINLLDQQSFISILSKFCLQDNALPIGDKLKNAVIYSAAFAQSITVFMQNSDKNFIYLGRDKACNTLLRKNFILQRHTEQVAKKDFEKFEGFVHNLCSFIKVFMDELATIEIKKDENGDVYDCELIFVYADGRRVCKKHESAGIQKIIESYSALCSVESGNIVFIDAFDANIHDALLVKLVEYVMHYADGQLIFTTHNLAPMDVLQKAKHSIDFLSPDSQITSWTANGNYTAASLYRKGLIEYSPFNLEAFSFIGVFGR